MPGGLQEPNIFELMKSTDQNHTTGLEDRIEGQSFNTWQGNYNVKGI